MMPTMAVAMAACGKAVGSVRRKTDAETARSGRTRAEPPLATAG